MIIPYEIIIYIVLILAVLAISIFYTQFDQKRIDEEDKVKKSFMNDINFYHQSHYLNKFKRGK
tara:strand:- start:126 stop:314 length:189 start_codon:yes stop_codon:yes gene_type:complete